MKKQISLAGIVILAAVAGVFMAGQGDAGEASGLKDSVLKIAAALKKGDSASADTQAAAVAKKLDGLDDLMDLFKPRDKGGIGVGMKAGVAVPDGIEKKLLSVGRDSPSAGALKKEGAALEDMGYAIAAIARVTKNKPVPQAKAKEWNGWCDDLAAGGAKFSAAAKSMTAADLKMTASKINAACNACHSTYRK